MSLLLSQRSNNEIIEPRISFEDVPLWAMTQRTREKLSLLLSPEKVLVSEDGYYRDWRGIFTLSGLTQSEFSLISQCQDKTNKLFDLWIKRNKDNNNVITLAQFQECLATIDRYDVHDDISTLLADDARFFLSKPQTSDKVANNNPYEIVKADPDNDIITLQDLECSEKGLPLVNYDAFVIYSDRDVEFASELVERCENLGYTLCVKDRDLLGGLSFESEAILNILSKRCNRLIVIVSKAFLQSPMQIFLTNFAQALGIEQGKRKIIPCLIEPCDLPQMLRFCFRLDYYRNNKLFDFWDKLDKSLKATTDMKRTNSQEQKMSKNSESEASSNSLKLNIPSNNGPLYDKEQLFKFSDTPTPPEKSKKAIKTFFMKKSDSPEVKKQIMPPPPNLRTASSMLNLNFSNGSTNQVKNSLSKSTFHLNQEFSEDVGMSAIKKRKKWYKKFLPPKDAKVVKGKVADDISEDAKRPWYKINKKKDKQKDKIAVACES